MSEYVRCETGGCGATHDGEPYLCPLHAAAGGLLKSLEELLEVSHVGPDPDDEDCREFRRIKEEAAVRVAAARRGL